MKYAPIKLEYDMQKGWKVVATDIIPKDTFICEYAGEVISE